MPSWPSLIHFKFVAIFRRYNGQHEVSKEHKSHSDGIIFN